jgi:VWFA-related protein
MNRFTAAIAALALSAMPLAAQAPAFGEKVDVNVVLIDAVVTDSTGNQILGLSKDDFIVTEDGRQVTVDSLDYYTNRQLLDAREESAPFKVERVSEDRYFIFFFDKSPDATNWDQLTLARKGVEDFMNERMRPGDKVAIAGHDVRLKVFSDFTTDKAQLKRALVDATRFGRGLMKPAADDGNPSILRSIDLKAMVNKSGTVYEGLDLLGESLRGIRGRKNLVIFSPGMREPGETVSNGMLIGRSRYWNPMIASLNSANVTAYTINLLRFPPTEPMFHQSLENLAIETGGDYYRNSVSFNSPLQRVDRSNSGYYLLTYRSSHPEGTSGFQKVKVALRNPEFRIHARPGYAYGQQQ